ncbi:putative lipoprotein [Pseudomonas syringae pv. helianthi]|uniref:Putative lipoprotein n=2 Tax=Pseudomonas syringae group TaxID=136849 RepID=A0A0P9RGF4_9PSED|nr:MULTISPECIES: alpha/beta fold hydrolase [Pseudomonas syringae group]KPX46912.1 putative lipoprotein [Pseudomonas syringae pv. helianthi]RMR03457.1 putative Lipoprotein [Pseudomonas syringae pv. helianthi]RMV09914.1 putative Lipoprotein [Pseudomonas savastanoi]RMV46665.1 putative Lipoprotein [Pseudomonas syringae pv. helianthi]UNB65268.1 lysophospholipase [Pseudomonas syringae pv. helianthi]
MIKSRLASLLTLLTLQACTSMAESEEPTKRFEDYRQQTIELMRTQRNFQTADHEAELGWNAPQQWTPTGVLKGGVLLVHGLGDSPWSFHDVARKLADQGYLVRTVLLPGHGTKPEAMLDVRLEQWQQVVREQVQQLGREVPKVYLGGFSTGANLVLDYAYDHADIAGLILFSPAFRSNSGYAWLTPWIGWARPWLATPNDGLRPMQTPVRYMNMPTNGFAQFYRSSALAQARLHQRRYDKPVFIAIAEHDSVLDTDYVLDTFSQRFSHPASQLIWYGELPARAAETTRVKARKDSLADYRISRFSHMGLLFSPDNPLYGVSGSQRICWNGQSTADTAQCMAGASVWYSDWGYTEPGKIHARLTFNPYFEWQTEVMLGVLNATP